jgi:DNA-binding LacI/PurR family transcriptional regulator
VQSRRVDGIVINRTRLVDWRVDYLLENKFPFVSRGKGETTAAYPYVDILDTIAVKELVAHLVEKGHHRIAFVGASPDLVIHSDRLNGYSQALEAAGIPFDEGLVQQGDLSEKGGYYAALNLLSRAKPPTAIIGCNDLTALGVLRAAKEKGLYIGTELAIAGYDGIKETEYTNPPLTTIYQPTYDIARELAKMLIKLIEGVTLTETCITVRPQLVIRASTG